MTIKNGNTSLQKKLLEQTGRRSGYLTSGEVYTLAAILGEQFWEDEDEVSHNTLGRAFSTLVSEGRLPFQPNGWTSNRHNEYRYMPFEEEE